MRTISSLLVSGLFLVTTMVAGAGQELESSTPSADITQRTLGGNALALLPPVDNGSVEVIASGTRDGSNIPVVVRNNTSDVVADVNVKVEARNPGGILVGVGETPVGHAMKPYLLNPGDLAIGFVYVEGDLPADAVFTFTVSSSPGPGQLADFNIDVEFGKVNWLGDRIIGEFVNPTGQSLGSTYLMVECFSADGVPLLSDVNTIDELVPANGTATFQMNGVFGDISVCEHFLVAGTAHPET